MSGLDKNYSDTYVEANLLLALGEHLAMRRLGQFAKTMIEGVKKGVIDGNPKVLQNFGRDDCSTTVSGPMAATYCGTVI